MTGTRPAVRSTVKAMASRCSWSVRVEPSPVVPQITRASIPWSICQSISRPSWAKSMPSAVRGVMRAVAAPRKIGSLVMVSDSFSMGFKKQQPTEAGCCSESGEESTRSLKVALRLRDSRRDILPPPSTAFHLGGLRRWCLSQAVQACEALPPLVTLQHRASTLFVYLMRSYHFLGELSMVCRRFPRRPHADTVYSYFFQKMFDFSLPVVQDFPGEILYDIAIRTEQQSRLS